MRTLSAGLLASLLITLSFPGPAEAAPGDLDPTFGIGGTVTTDFGDFGAATAIALQPDGKIVVAGFSGIFFVSRDFTVARYNPDGSLDASFGSAGKVTTDFGGITGDATALALQPDGKIVVAGFSADNFALARFNPDGKPGRDLR